jgi:VWFA-related protein
MLALTGAVWLLGTAGGSATAQEPATASPQTFGSAVDVIRIDAVVVDKQGRTVNGLTGEDFVVREDGNPQELTSFEAVELAPAAVAETPPPLSAAPRSSSNEVAAESPRRTFLIVMDDAGLGLAGGVAARKAAHQFLSDAARPGDLVSVIVPGAGLTWSAQLPEGKAQLASIVESVKGRRAGACDGVGGAAGRGGVRPRDRRAHARAPRLLGRASPPDAPSGRERRRLRGS